MSEQTPNYLRLLYLGSWKGIKSFVDSYEMIDNENFVMSDSKNTLVILFPLSDKNQVSLLKYVEDVERHIILFLPEYFSVIEPLQSRFMYKADETFTIHTTKLPCHVSLLDTYLKKGYLNKALRKVNERLL